MGWFPCAAALLGSPNAQGKPAQHIHLPLGGRTAPGKARSGRPTACSLEWAPWPTPWSLTSRDPASAQAEDSEETAGLPGTFRDPALTWRTASSSVGLPDLSQAGWILFPGLPRGRETAGTTGHLLTYRLSSVCSVCCSHRAPSEYSTETYVPRDLMPAGSQSLAPH